MLALNGSHWPLVRFAGRDEKHRVLTAVLGFSENLDRPTQHYLSDLRTQILKSAPPDHVKSEI